jgi:glutamate 5-kinase
VTDEDSGRIKAGWINSLASDIADLHERGIRVVCVSSGAIALGRPAIGLDDLQSARHMRLEHKQAAAAAGQITLARHFSKSFADNGLHIAQILLSPNDTENRRAHLNARATLRTLLSRGLVPVINENDTVATDEIRFGDNDRLAARVAQMIAADTLIILSTTDGLYTTNPDISSEAEHIPRLDDISHEHVASASDVKHGISTGGMRSKLEAADIARNAGIDVYIAPGYHGHPLTKLQSGDVRHTFVRGVAEPVNARKRWISSHVSPSGAIYIDDGARTALRSGKSLLPAGVTKINGRFERGDPVEIYDQSGHVLGTGLSAYNSDDLVQIMGCHSQAIAAILGYAGREEAVHRDDLVMRERRANDTG